MTDEARIDRLAEALEAMLADPHRPVPAPDVVQDAELIDLLEIAQDLRDLPNPAFKARLKADLERRASMSAQTSTHTGEALQKLTVYLAVRPAGELIEFVKQAFGARELLR